MRVRWVRTAEMELPLVKLTVEPLRIQRAIADVASDLGYKSLTTEQADAITAFLHGRDVPICLPTGSGKCLRFALLPEVVHGCAESCCLCKIPVSKHTCRYFFSYQSNGRPRIPSIATKGRDNLHTVCV